MVSHADMASQVLAHANLSDPASFETALSAVKTYVKAKMIKYQSNAVGLPGGKVSHH